MMVKDDNILQADGIPPPDSDLGYACIKSGVFAQVTCEGFGDFGLDCRNLNGDYHKQ